MPGWLRGMNGEAAASGRLLFKDTVELSPEATPRLVELLLTQLREPWCILRLISAATNRGGDRYLSSSELAEFCERVLDDVERRMALLRAFDYDAGANAGAAASEALATAIAELGEFEECLDLGKEGPWGQRVIKQKGALSALAEGNLKKCSKVIGEALPLQPVRVNGAVIRSEPRLDAAPDPRQVNRAMACLTFLSRCRSSAAQGGYGSVRARALEEITHRLDRYIEDILSLIHSGEAADIGHARAFLEAAAEFIGLAQDEKSAQIVRRRAAAAA